MNATGLITYYDAFGGHADIRDTKDWVIQANLNLHWAHICFLGFGMHWFLCIQLILTSLLGNVVRSLCSDM